MTVELLAQSCCSSEHVIELQQRINQLTLLLEEKEAELSIAAQLGKALVECNRALDKDYQHLLLSHQSALQDTLSFENSTHNERIAVHREARQSSEMFQYIQKLENVNDSLRGKVEVLEQTVTDLKKQDSRRIQKLEDEVASLQNELVEAYSIIESHHINRVEGVETSGPRLPVERNLDKRKELDQSEYILRLEEKVEELGICCTELGKQSLVAQNSELRETCQHQSNVISKLYHSLSQQEDLLPPSKVNNDEEALPCILQRRRSLPTLHEELERIQSHHHNCRTTKAERSIQWHEDRTMFYFVKFFEFWIRLSYYCGLYMFAGVCELFSGCIVAHHYQSERGPKSKLD